ncbi:MAG: HD domain-containing protein [Candidatus Diapherotrites archaeon]|nr:HD domain-containing protein [Candidatus Diapherotrites archaeon]
MEEELRNEIVGFINTKPSSEWNLRHVKMVVETALELAEKYPKADKEVVEIGAWLHDVGHPTLREVEEKGSPTHHLVGKEMAEEFLPTTRVAKEKIPAILHCIEAHRTSKPPAPETIEARIVASADNLAHFKDFEWLLEAGLSYEDGMAKLQRNLKVSFMLPEAIQYGQKRIKEIQAKYSKTN